MATYLFRADGTEETLTPANGAHWSLEELQKLVGGYIEVVRTKNGRWLVIDEDGKNKNKRPNLAATELYRYGDFDVVRGDAVFITDFQELNGPPDPEEE